MEECEALCSRIGFLNKGCLVGIGSNQELKSRFGTNFVLTLTVANPSEEVHHFLDEKIRTLFEVSNFYIHTWIPGTVALFRHRKQIMCTLLQHTFGESHELVDILNGRICFDALLIFVTDTQLMLTQIYHPTQINH